MRPLSLVLAGLIASVPMLCATPALAEPLQTGSTATDVAGGVLQSMPVMASLPQGPVFAWKARDNLGMCVGFSNDLTPGLSYSLALTAVGGNSQVVGSSAVIVQTGYDDGTSPTACVPGGVFNGFGAASYTATAIAIVVFPPSAPVYQSHNECSQTTVRTVCAL